MAAEREGERLRDAHTEIETVKLNLYLAVIGIFNLRIFCTKIMEQIRQ